MHTEQMMLLKRDSTVCGAEANFELWALLKNLRNIKKKKYYHVIFFCDNVGLEADVLCKHTSIYRIFLCFRPAAYGQMYPDWW